MSNLVGKTILERYNVQEFLGRGGMAEVYKVWDSHRMTYLAMKVLLEDLAIDRVFVRRFSREADNLAKLQHPNIVRFYEFEKEDRLAFILMEYIKGETLKHLIHDAQGPLPASQVRVVIRAVCGALHYAHNSGFVHCDIKPANIMIDQNVLVQLADFGIARMSDAATATMVGAGTPAYMAPEQVRGQDPSPQTDIYAMGIVLYEMLTGGERPFTGEHAQTTGGTSEKVRWEQLNLQPPSPRKWNPDLSPELEAVILKCLKKAPNKRFKNSLELLNAMELALGEPAIEEKDAQELRSTVRERVQRDQEAEAVLSPKPEKSQFAGWLEELRSRKKLVTLIGIAFLIILCSISTFFMGKDSSPRNTAVENQDQGNTAIVEVQPTVSEENSPEPEAPEISSTTTQFMILPILGSTNAPSPTLTHTPTTVPPTARPSVRFIAPSEISPYIANGKVLGDLANETYSQEERSKSNNTLEFTISMKPSQIVIWRWYWCATTTNILNENMKDFDVEFVVNNEVISHGNFREIEFPLSGWKCSGKEAILFDWAPGDYHLVQKVVYTKDIYDGEETYSAGEKVYDYTIYVE